VLCIESGRLLSFIISKDGIRLDPLKVHEILDFPPPASLHQLQSLQGKENFLQQFFINYVELTKGFTWLLKKDTKFSWDNIAQESFDSLKHALTNIPLIHPPNYHKDYLFYLAAADSTIAMVLVQEDESNEEHVI